MDEKLIDRCEAEATGPILKNQDLPEFDKERFVNCVFAGDDEARRSGNQADLMLEKKLPLIFLDKKPEFENKFIPHPELEVIPWDTNKKFKGINPDAGFPKN